jgi:hypothetical protein
MPWTREKRDALLTIDSRVGRARSHLDEPSPGLMLRRQRGFAALHTHDMRSSRLPMTPKSHALQARLTVSTVRSPQDFERNERSEV